MPATEFLGRSRELDEVVERLRNGVRLLTLTGPGGTGKTRLALQAAAEAADDFDDGVWWVPLAALRDPALVLRQTAKTLDVIEQPDRPLEDVLAEMLGGKRMLLLLDNAEHLLPGAADAIATLRDLDGPKLVVTSRERLQLAGEHVYPVPQLTALEGLDLFTARAAAIDPAFEATAAVAELCEPARQPAARARARRRPYRRPSGPSRSSSGWASRLDLLKGGRDADPRQQTLRATIAWSYDLLAPRRARALRPLRGLRGRRDARGGRGGLRRRPRDARLARRQEPRPARRRPLLDARDDPRVRHATSSTTRRRGA